MSNRKKAKELSTGKWVYGSVTRANLDVYIVDKAKTVDGKLIIEEASIVNMQTLCDFVTIISTNDSMFAELYEHDVIKCGELIGEVVDNDDLLQWELLTKNGDSFHLGKIIDEHVIENIIGNSIDIPEYAIQKKIKRI